MVAALWMNEVFVKLAVAEQDMTKNRIAEVAAAEGAVDRRAVAVVLADPWSDPDRGTGVVHRTYPCFAAAALAYLLPERFSTPDANVA